MIKKEFKNRIEYYDDMGRLHRTDGPAVEYFETNTKEWWEFGKRHRADGPAQILSNGREFYYFDGKLLSEKEFKLLTRKLKILKISNL